MTPDLIHRGAPKLPAAGAMSRPRGITGSAGPGRLPGAAFLRNLFIDLSAFLFPLACVGCGAPLPTRLGRLVCRDCRRRLTPVVGPTCLACRVEGRSSHGFAAGRGARPGPGFEADAPGSSPAGLGTSSALEAPSSPACPRGHEGFLVYAAVQMVDPADRLVHALKFHDRPEVGASLAVLLARRLRREGADDWDWLIPMPLHPVRQRARGYNQSLEIAGRLARSLGAGCLVGELSRKRPTRPQADLDYAARGDNVAGAFQLVQRRRRSDRGRNPVEGKRCLLIDDVATTGHTLMSAMTVLRQENPAATAAAVFALA